MKKILFAASESVPFIKTGGLADVVGSLPKYFDKEKYDVRVMLPKYMCMKDEWKEKLQYHTHFYMDLNWRKQYVGVLEMEYDGIKFYFIDNEYYFNGYAPYGDMYADIEKFAFFSKAVLSALPLIDFRPDIIHCHDWQTGLVPIYLDNFRYGNEFYRGIKTVMTIHNLKFQGTWDPKRVRDITGLPQYYFAPDKLEAYKDANYLKGGIVYADRVTTVSNSYAEEIKMPFYGEGLDGLMRARANSLRGIVNGIDYDDFNPETDKYIVQQYTAKNFRKEKVKNKKALQQQLGLPVDEKKFMVGIVSRLTDQKGFDLVAYVMDELCQDAVQIVALGTGEEQYENLITAVQKKESELAASKDISLISDMTKPEKSLGGRSRAEIEETVLCYAQAQIDEMGLTDEVKLLGARVYGSRTRAGLYHDNSDIDVVLSYTGNIHEDSFFNVLHEDGMKIAGLPLDINPISAEKTGTLEEFMENAGQYLDMKEIQHLTSDIVISGTKDSCSDTDHSCSFFDCNFIIIGHPH